MIYKVFHKYRSHFYKEQLEKYKTTLKKKMIWLLKYSDPKLKDNYPDMDIHLYFINFMKEIGGLNELLLYPEPIPQIMSLLEASEIERLKIDFCWETYRKLILDAHAIVDTIGKKEVFHYDN